MAVSEQKFPTVYHPFLQLCRSNLSALRHSVVFQNYCSKHTSSLGNHLHHSLAKTSLKPSVLPAGPLALGCPQTPQETERYKSNREGILQEKGGKQLEMLDDLKTLMGVMTTSPGSGCDGHVTARTSPSHPQVPGHFVVQEHSVFLLLARH